MPAYSVVGEATNTASTTILYFVNGASNARRLKLFEFNIGSDDAPADNAVQYQIRRVTDENATPGGTAVTPVPVDEDDGSALSNAVEDPTGEPTYESGALIELALNKRATYRWIASPGRECVCSATEDHGFGIYSVQASTAFNTNATLMYEE